jgi:hypothetical protein
VAQRFPRAAVALPVAGALIATSRFKILSEASWNGWRGASTEWNPKDRG